MLPVTNKSFKIYFRDLLKRSLSSYQSRLDNTCFSSLTDLYLHTLYSEPFAIVYYDFLRRPSTILNVYCWNGKKNETKQWHTHEYEIPEMKKKIQKNESCFYQMFCQMSQKLNVTVILHHQQVFNTQKEALR